MPGTARTSIIVALSVFAVSCGSGAQGGEAGSAALRIDSAEWLGGPEPRIAVSGEWGLGLSTPPSCALLEGENGEKSDRYGLDNGLGLDGDRFYGEFVRAPGFERPDAPEPQTGYYVRCRVSMSTGKAVEATAPVEGSIPASG